MFSRKYFSWNLKFLISNIMLATFFTSCSSVSSISVSPTPTSTPTITVTQSPTVMPTTTLAPTLTSTNNQILPPSLTPLPTVHFDEIAFTFEKLLATNGGCRLPCFWGMTPGKTTVAELLQFTGQFTMPGFDMLNTDDGTYTFRYLKSQTEPSRWVVQFLTNGGKIRGIDLIAETAQYSFPLSKTLSEYGVPEKVLIGPEVFEALPMMVLYEGQRIMGSYYLYQDNIDKSLYCYSPGSTSQEIVIWAPNEDWRSFIGPKEEQSYKPLDEVSDYDITSFHEVLRMSNKTLCMKIQTDKILP